MYKPPLNTWTPILHTPMSRYTAWKMSIFQSNTMYELLLCFIMLKVSWTARRSNQLILKQVSPEYSLEGLMLKLQLQYFGHLMQRADSLKKTLMLGKIEGRRRRGWQNKMVGWTWVWTSSGSWWWTGKPGVLQSMGLQRVGHNWATELK